jgi:hypothetical protein
LRRRKREELLDITDTSSEKNLNYFDEKFCNHFELSDVLLRRIVNN